jgi:TM2 domain-containing membrane protein YozV
MKVIAILLNLLLPGVGTMTLGKIGQGVAQLILALLGAFLSVMGIFLIFGVPLYIGALIWSLVSAATTQTAGAVVVQNINTSSATDATQATDTPNQEVTQ